VFAIVHMRAMKPQLFMVKYLYLKLSITLFECFFHVRCDTLSVLLTHNNPVNNHFDGMLFCFAKLYLLIKAYHHTIYHGTDISFMDKRL